MLLATVLYLRCCLDCAYIALLMSLLGRFYRVFTFGESHSSATGCLIEGFPSNFPLNLQLVQHELNRRKPGQSAISTPRQEDDRVECLAGMEHGRTLGSPLFLMVRNQNVKKGDYDAFSNVPRPGHADFTYLKKYGLKASSGGGRSSARETIGRVIAGSVAKQYLEGLKIGFASWVHSVGDHAIPQESNQAFIRHRITNQRVDELSQITSQGTKYYYQRNSTRYVYDAETQKESQDHAATPREHLEAIPNVRCPHQPTAIRIYEAISRIKQQHDSLGGVVQGCIYNLPIGLGEPVFDKIQAVMAHAMLSIPATKGFEFGSGFAGSRMRGSEHNDLFGTDMRLQSNHSGGSLGGITTGETFEFKVAFKPVSTISKVQLTSSLSGELVALEGKGRHDPCVLPRAPPIVDNMAAMVAMDLVLSARRHEAALLFMFDYFVFPVNFNDIEQDSLALNRHRVMLVDVAGADRDVLRRLKAVDSQFNANYDAITEPDNFDFLYSLIKAFGENIETKSLKILEELSATIQYLTEQMLRHMGELSEESNIPKLRLAFKMTIFLCLYFVSATTLKKQRAAQGDIIADTINKEKGRRKPRNEGFELSRGVTESQKRCVGLLRESLRVDFNAVWEKKEVDTEFFKKYVDVCIKILESSLVRDEEVSACIFDIIETILRANHCESLHSSFQTVLANLVYEGDVIDNLVTFFAKAEGPELQKLTTQALTLVVIYLVNKQNLNSESQSIRNTKEFLSKLSERIPKTFYTNLSCFIVLFRHDSYYLRNAIADIMLNILKHVMHGPDADDLYRDSKEKFITTLLQRIYDKSSFCRSHVLGILAHLAAEKLVPRKYLILFMKAGIDRVKDQSVNTRRRALQLINAVVDELCTKEVAAGSEVDREIEIAELELKTLHEEEERVKGEIDQAEEEERLEELVTEVKLVRKRVKATEERQLGLFEEKEIGSLVERVVDSVRLLLGSKNETDVLETVKLFIKLHRLRFARARDALPDIRILIFSKEKKIKDEVLTNFIYLHLNAKSEDVARELVTLFTNASPQDLSALEEILETIISESQSKGITIIKPQAWAHMWNQFIAFERGQTHPGEKRAIMSILRIAFSRDPRLIKSENLESFLNILKAYVQTNEPDFHIVKEIARVITLDDPHVHAAAKNFLIAQIYILVNTQGTSDNQWFSACENVLTCVFKICESPEKLTELLIKKLHERLERDKSVKALAHFIFALAHNCLKCLIYLDSIEAKIKGIKQRQLTDDHEEELERVMGGAEAELERKIEEIQLLAEKILEDPFIHRWIGVVEKIVVNFRQGSELEVTCVLAYCKFMCLSAHFCEQKFPHVVRLLQSPHANSVVKNNIIIAMGDLLHRFPNVIEPYNKHLYQNLHEKDARVRKTTLTVITHLSLNDMIKVKSDMCDVALLFQDPDPEIESLVKQFFHEMNKKDPKVLFNLIPDALARFSSLEKIDSAPHTADRTDSTFKVFLENVLPLLEKDKYSESLVVKLCERLANSLNMLEIVNTAHCLAELNINEKGLRRIIENFESFRKTLENPDVHLSFRNLLSKLRKYQKNDLKSLIEELEEKVAHSGEEIFNAEEIKRRNQERLNKKQPKKRPAAGSGSAGPKRNKKKRGMSEDEEEEEFEMEVEPTQTARTRPQRTARRMRIIEESEEAEIDAEDDEDFAN